MQFWGSKNGFFCIFRDLGVGTSFFDFKFGVFARFYGTILYAKKCVFLRFLVKNHKYCLFVAVACLSLSQLLGSKKSPSLQNFWQLLSWSLFSRTIKKCVFFTGMATTLTKFNGIKMHKFWYKNSDFIVKFKQFSDFPFKNQNISEKSEHLSSLGYYLLFFKKTPKNFFRACRREYFL